MYDVRVSNERGGAVAAAAAMWSFIFGLTILDLMKSKMVDTVHFSSVHPIIVPN